MSDEVVIVEVVKRMERDLKQFDLILFLQERKSTGSKRTGGNGAGLCFGKPYCKAHIQ